MKFNSKKVSVVAVVLAFAAVGCGKDKSNDPFNGAGSGYGPRKS
jgi:uncharacterized lipoprotein YehR (DUF1307 family)